MLWGLIKSRDSEEMTKTSKKYRYVDIDIEIIRSNITDMESIVTLFERYKDKTYKMIESVAYYEAYVHVLNKIKEMDHWDRIPFMD